MYMCTAPYIRRVRVHCKRDTYDMHVARAITFVSDNGIAVCAYERACARTRFADVHATSRL